MLQISQQRNEQFCFSFCAGYAIFRGRTMERSKYANYRYSNYVQDGVAVLKIGPDSGPAKPTNDKLMNSNKNNNTLYSVRFNSRTNLPNASKTQRSNAQNKSLYNDKAVRTTKNFIGKPWYNVGYPPDS